MNSFPSCQPQLAFLLNVLSPLQPRYYSIANDFSQSDGLARIIFNVVEHQLTSSISGDSTHSIRYGLCTSWLDDLTTQLLDMSDDCDFSTLLSPPRLIPLFHRAALTSFRLPVQFSLPVILIGPGTGIAPFIGFCEQRQREKLLWKPGDPPLGKLYLIYGCRHRDRDFLYRKELYQFVTESVIDQLLVSYSRDVAPTSPIPMDDSMVDHFSEHYMSYVQQSLLCHSSDIGELLCVQNARLYVCGDALSMAKQVNDAIVTIVQEFTKTKNEEESRAVVQSWIDEKRYLRDIWT